MHSWGTLAESFAKLADSIYFQSPDRSTLFVNLFESSSVRWGGLTVTQTASFPVDPKKTTSITITNSSLTQGTGNSTIALRVPFWATSASNFVSVNGQPIEGSRLVPSSYVTITRGWAVGDLIQVEYPLVLRFEQVDDPRASFVGFGTFFYGPLLLAGLTTDDTLIVGNKTIEQIITRNPTQSLEFVASSNPTCSTPGRTISMIPFNQLRNAHASANYQVYFHTQLRSGRTTPAGTDSFQLGQQSDFLLRGGSSILSNFDLEQDLIEGRDAEHKEHEHVHRTSKALEDPAHGHFAVELDYDPITGNHYGVKGPAQLTSSSSTALNLRSGSPKGHSVASMSAPFEGASTIKSIAFGYQFVIGYGTTPNSTGARLSFVFLDNPDCPLTSNSTVLYTSARYVEPSWDKCHECYKSVNVSVDELNLDTNNGGAFAFKFDNGDHNMQLLLPITFTVGWQ